MEISGNILIVGGAGFVGSNLVKRILKQKKNVIKIVIVDNLLSSEKFNIPVNKKVKFINGSIAESKILKTIQDSFDYIFHLATYHGNESSIFDPIADFHNNTETTLKLFNHIKNFKNLKKIVYSSAGCSVAKKTFSNVEATKENDPINLQQDSPYSISKIVGEFYSLFFFKQYSLQVVRTRFQNVYGPGEILGAGKWRGTPATIWRNVTPTFIYKALKGLPLPVINKGIATRDFIYVDDICNGLILSAELGKSGDVYNLASGEEISILTLAEKINNCTENSAGIIFLPQRKWDTSGKRFGSTLKSKKELNFKTKTDISEGLNITIDWTKKNLDLIDKAILKHVKYYKI